MNVENGKRGVIVKSSVLFISGYPDDANRLSQMLEELPLGLVHVANLQQARRELHRCPYSVILSEAFLPDGKWVDALDLARECEGVEVIVTDQDADARLWAEALNLGAYDVLSQPFYEPEVRRILQNACSRQEATSRSWAAAN
jgi:DNA-binding NtrC family response regulator